MNIFRTVLAALCLALAGVAPAMAHDGHNHGAKPADAAAKGNVTLEGQTPAVSEPETVPKAEPEPNVLTLLSNLHPAAVHFPIALLIMAAVAELLSVTCKSARLAEAGAIIAVMGGVSASVATLLGWVHTGLWFGGDAVMQWHRWIGTGLGFAGPLIAWLAMRRSSNLSAYRLVLVLAAAALLAQGFFGAEISRGVGHLWK